MRTPTRRRLRWITVLLCYGAGTGTSAGSIYQWTDLHGQTHFADRPPDSTATLAPLLPASRTPHATGLRPGEIAALQASGQRTRRQKLRARSARERSAQQQAAGRADCLAHREQMHSSSGKDAFKKHARYLRTHCW